MELTEVGPETFYNYKLDLTDEEYSTFLNYAHNKLESDEIDAMFIEWALIDVLKGACKEALENKS